MKKPLVSVIMGSSSDSSIMAEAVKMLTFLDISFEEKIISAHRNPKKLAAYAEQARGSGIEVVIAGAGKAAHLAGTIAALTTLPVIGVPISTADLGGLDALLSIVQMPSGVPVATVAINGAKNAAILAAQILALKYTEIDETVTRFKKELGEG